MAAKLLKQQQKAEEKEKFEKTIHNASEPNNEMKTVTHFVFLKNQIYNSWSPIWQNKNKLSLSLFTTLPVRCLSHGLCFSVHQKKKISIQNWFDINT